MTGFLFNFFILVIKLGGMVGNGVHSVYTPFLNFSFSIFLEKEIAGSYAFSLKYLRWYYDLNKHKGNFNSLNTGFSKIFYFTRGNLSLGLETGLSKTSQIVDGDFYFNIGTFLYYHDFYKIKNKLSFIIGIELEKGWTPLRVLDAPNPPVWINRYDLILGIYYFFYTKKEGKKND